MYFFLSDTAGVHAELEKMTKTQKQTKRAQSDVNPNGPSSASWLVNSYDHVTL